MKQKTGFFLTQWMVDRVHSRFSSWNFDRKNAQKLADYYISLEVAHDSATDAIEWYASKLWNSGLMS